MTCFLRFCAMQVELVILPRSMVAENPKEQQNQPPPPPPPPPQSQDDSAEDQNEENEEVVANIQKFLSIR